MSTQDLQELALGVVYDHAIAKPEVWDGLLPKGDWIVADVLKASLSVNVHRGEFTGFVSIRLQGSEEERIEDFRSLWMQGWTSWRFMIASKEARKKERKGSKRKK